MSSAHPTNQGCAPFPFPRIAPKTDRTLQYTERTVVRRVYCSTIVSRLRTGREADIQKVLSFSGREREVTDLSLLVRRVPSHILHIRMHALFSLLKIIAKKKLINK